MPLTLEPAQLRQSKAGGIAGWYSARFGFKALGLPPSTAKMGVFSSAPKRWRQEEEFKDLRA